MIGFRCSIMLLFYRKGRIGIMIIASNGQLIDQNVNKEFPIKIKRIEYYEPGPVLKKHWHEELMIFYIETGKAVIHCNSQPIPVGTGDLVVINSNDIHYVENCCNHLIENYIVLDFAFLLSYKEDLCQTKYIAPLMHNRIRFENKITDDAELIRQFLELIREYRQKLQGYELSIKAGLYRVLVLLLRRHTVPAAHEVEFRRHDQLRPVLQYVDEHYNQKITLEQLAAMANVSRHHLCRLFKSMTGMPPIEYINHLRINAAMKLLQQHRLPVSEVALIVGFTDSNYFSRLFKKYKNMSPTSVRKEDH